ncbi:TetR/AcrR family transcriptional regulator [Nocardioides alcanivorans]|uniref:TetR/AcrR family transcriptional regulator n=1 Tax=Nocardioides alcanivorans TaxID=2897352 RepID=UPI001F302D6C|nr:TetR/AcrR family transcriptional regulator [Nocardioides alcanivorans]
MTKDPKEALVEVAERLFAEHGPDGASLRDIARAAGQRNNSAVQYHFGNRENLVAEVFRRRMTQINAVRAERLRRLDSAGEQDSLESLVATLLEPLVEHVRAAGSSSTYAQFMVRTMPGVDFEGEQIAEVNAVQRELGMRMERLVPHLDSGAFQRRVGLAMTMAVSALADFERRWNLGLEHERHLDALLAEVVTMTAAALQAPAT